MGRIALLDKDTIDKIAAGEVVERPSSVVKELTENAIDAGATMITVELKEGGNGFIRITDNGSGIAAEEVRTAFLRHSTSKIRTVEDLLTAGSLGFRGEALSSIAAVAQVELITKTKDSFTGSRYCIEGGAEGTLEEAGCPDGTTFLVRNLFYNVPARRKFLKSAMTEAGYCSELMQRMALSRPEIAYKFINSGKIVLQTSGNGNLKEVIYQIYGREVAANLLEVSHLDESAGIKVSGFLGKPVVSRGNRNYENYFINGRYIKSSIISKAIEEAYRPYMMQHKYPFTALHIFMDTAMLDVNVHPTKLEVRFSDGEAVYYAVYHAVKEALSGKNMIPQVGFGKETKAASAPLVRREERPEQFETARLRQQEKETARPGQQTKEKETGKPAVQTSPATTAVTGQGRDSLLREAPAPYHTENRQYSTNVASDKIEATGVLERNAEKPQNFNGLQILQQSEKGRILEEKEAEGAVLSSAVTPLMTPPEKEKVQKQTPPEPGTETENRKETPELPPEQMELPDLLREKNKKEYRIIGQLFSTYWLIEMEGQLFMIDQHAAHEKILFEQTMKRVREKEMLTQQLAPPYVATLSIREEEVLKEQAEVLRRLGFEFEPFGGRDYKVSGVPADLCGLTGGELFVQLLDELVEERLHGSPELLVERVASMSCKAAVKGNQTLSLPEAETMIDLLFTLDNPYHCPHGRPTTISMSRQEIEKKFKRIV